MSNLSVAATPSTLRWEGAQASRVPFDVYTDPSLYTEELRRFFYTKHWCYVGLEAEIPNTGDFKRTVIGERSVVLVRDREGALRVFENVCAHRGAQFCRERYGNAKTFTCPYHSWNYDLDGRLRGLPYRQGLKTDEGLKGGMPADFKLGEHSLRALKVESRGGLVFASFDPDIEPLADYLGLMMCHYVDRIFDGRKLKILGYNRQRIPGNWKLMQENIKDPYHPGLLHTWFVVFGLWRADSQIKLLLDDHRRHAAMVGVRATQKPSSEVTQGVSSFRDKMKLHDPRQIDIVVEPWWNGPTVTMLTIFPSLIIQQQVNSLSTRHIQPRGGDAFDFIWTHFGFEEDSEEMTQRRLVQANLFGPSGYVSADDGEVIEFSQMGYRSRAGSGDGGDSLVEMGGRDSGDADIAASETLIRGMYEYWRKVMDI